MEDESYINQIKLFYILIKIGADVYVQALKTLYKGPSPMELNLIDLANTVSTINKDEKKLLEKIKCKQRELSSLDIGLSYKLLQVACGLAPIQASSSQWSARCPKDKQNSLEYYLFSHKSKRDEITHQLAANKCISDELFSEIRRENIKNLKAIVEKVGEIVKLSEIGIKMQKNRIQMESEIFSQQLGFGRRSTQHSPIFQEKGTQHQETEDSPRKDELGMEGEHVAKPKRSLSTNSWFQNIFKLSKRTKSCEGLGFTPIDYSPIIKRTLLVGFGKDLLSEEDAKQLYEKADRMYWINKLVSSGALEDRKKIRKFWKEYDKNSA